jgi:hydrophobe/amphiphile efflux-3 (HAE3) family protein
VRSVWLALARFIGRYHVWIAVGGVALTAGLAFGIPRIEFKTGQDTIVPAGSKVFQDNLRYQEEFGGDPVLVLFEGDIRRLFVSPNVEVMSSLEDELNESGLFDSVVTPLTVAGFAKEQVSLGQEAAPTRLAAQQEAAAEEARRQAAEQGASPEEQEAAAEVARGTAREEFLAEQAADAQRFAEVGEQSLDNPSFIDFLLFDAQGNVRPELTGVFPDPRHALLVARLAGNTTFDEQSEAAGEAVELVRARKFEGFEVVATGPAVLIKEINDNMRSSMLNMAALALAIMVVVLFLVFRARWRILSLLVMLVGCISAFGLMGFLGFPLTMVTISGLPILIGLGVDFAIQFHNRMEEETARQGGAGAGLSEALLRLGPAVALAMLTSVVGFMVLHMSRVPMIRDFGSMLTVGVVILFLFGLFFLNSLIFLRDRGQGDEKLGQPPVRRLEVGRFVSGLSGTTVGRILPVVVVGVAIGLLGLFLDRHIAVQTDPERFVSEDSPVLQELHRIRDTAGSSSDLGVMVEASDVTSQDVLTWMADFERRQMEEHPELFRSNSLVSTITSVTGAPPTPEDAERILDVAPSGIRENLVSADLTRAQIVFAIGTVSLEERKTLVDQIRRDLDTPAGVSAMFGGVSVIGVEAVAALSQNRGLMTFAALGAILVGLFLVYRNAVKALAPVLPILMAVGCSSVLLFLLDIELNPLTAVSGPLIIAMGVDFTILIMSRYFEEREKGQSPREAMSTASLRIGQAITASGLTVVGGFGVLAFSDFPLLVDFGKVTALNMGLCLLSALVVLPPLLVWADEETGLVPQREEKLGTIE